VSIGVNRSNEKKCPWSVTARFVLALRRSWRILGRKWKTLWIGRPSWRGPLQDFFCCNVLVHERTDAGKKLPAPTAQNQNDLW
jgi:hypothetical protein